MNILWITNIALPPVCEAMGIPVPAIGGWMYSSLKRLKEASDNKFAVATVWNGGKLVKKEIDDVVYYLLPTRGKDSTVYNSDLESFWNEIKDDFKPDVTHIHGTEFPMGLAYVRKCGTDGVVTSIQGLISVISRYYTAGMDSRSLRQSLTFRDIVKRDSISRQQKAFVRRGKYEIELIGSVKDVIGRTDWDRAHVKAINPDVRYHFCGETLRDSFYQHKWNYSGCEPYSIFVSQAGYPIKGLHILLKALPLVIREFPETKVYCAGDNIFDKPWFRISGYGKYVKKIISDNSLENRIIFTGSLDEKKMCERYLKSNLFVCPSAIENSPNSLGEAQLLRMPHLASFVGGVPEIAGMNHDVLYRFEEYEMLAGKICDVFSAGDKYVVPEADLSRYDGVNNCEDLLKIYEDIFSRRGVSPSPL